jgi:hypothetical protein
MIDFDLENLKKASTVEWFPAKKILKVRCRTSAWGEEVCLNLGKACLWGQHSNLWSEELKVSSANDAFIIIGFLGGITGQNFIREKAKDGCVKFTRADIFEGIPMTLGKH